MYNMPSTPTSENKNTILDFNKRKKFAGRHPRQFLNEGQDEKNRKMPSKNQFPDRDKLKTIEDKFDHAMNRGVTISAMGKQVRISGGNLDGAPAYLSRNVQPDQTNIFNFKILNTVDGNIWFGLEC